MSETNDPTTFEGLWSIQFASDIGVVGAGVVVLETERVFGGGAQYIYLGKFKAGGKHEISAEITVTHYAGEPYFIFGTGSEFSLQLSGTLSGDTISGVGTRVDDPSRPLRVILTKRASLP